MSLYLYEDISRCLGKLNGVPRPQPESIFEGVEFTRGFVSQIYKWLKNSGRHQFLPAAELKKVAEDFSGKAISETAFMVGLSLTTFTKVHLDISGAKKFVINPAKFHTLTIKYPPLDKLEGYRELWARVQGSLEKEVARNLEEIEVWKFKKFEKDFFGS